MKFEKFGSHIVLRFGKKAYICTGFDTSEFGVGATALYDKQRKVFDINITLFGLYLIVGVVWREMHA